MVSSFGERIRSKGLYPLDAFRAFDANNDGVINCSELYSGLRFMGLNVEPQLVYDIIKSADLDGDLALSFFEFKRTFGAVFATTDDDIVVRGDGGSGGGGSDGGASEGTIRENFEPLHVEQHKIPELGDILRGEEAEQESEAAKVANKINLEAVSFHVKPVKHFEEVGRGCLVEVSRAALPRGINFALCWHWHSHSHSHWYWRWRWR